MSVDTGKLITIAGLSNYHSRLMDQIDEAFEEYAPVVASDAEIDDACFGISEDDECPDDPNGNGEHSWSEDPKNGCWTCDNCGKTVYVDPTGSEEEEEPSGD